MMVEPEVISAGADERSLLFLEAKEPTAHLLQEHSNQLLQKNYGNLNFIKKLGITSLKKHARFNLKRGIQQRHNKKKTNLML